MDLNDIINNENNINNKNEDDNYYSNFITSLINKHKFITLGIGGMIGALGLFLFLIN